ncbi:MAG: hypothetical protein ACTHLY_15875 [Pseudolabrys sp.]
MGALARIIGTTLAGGLVLPLAVLAVMLVFYMMDSRCGTPGDSGGCEMGIAMMVLSASPVGAALGLIVGIVRSVRRRRTRSPS